MPISRPVGKQPPRFANAVPFDGTPRPTYLEGDVPAGTGPTNCDTRRSRRSLLPLRGPCLLSCSAANPMAASRSRCWGLRF